MARVRGFKRVLVSKKLEKRKQKKEKKETIQRNLEHTLGIRPARVSKVHVEGLCNTKDKVVQEVVANILKAETYNEVMNLTKTAHRELKALGCFQKVNAVIDNTKNDELEVCFEVEELAPTYVHGKMATGDNEMLGVLRAGIPNATGRGERIEAKYTQGSSGTRDIRLDFRVPIRSNLIWSNNSALVNNSFVASLYRRNSPMPSAGLYHSNRGLSLSANLSPKPWLTQLVNWEVVWRDTQASSTSDYTGFSARNNCGHTLKSSLLHMLTIDTRDDSALPSRGLHAVFSQELAGLGLGDVAFFKTGAKAAGMYPLTNNVSIGVSCATGVVSQLNVDDERIFSSLTESPAINPCDRFTMGGPLSMRGFTNHKMGPREDGNYLGGTAFWRAALHAFCSLPYIRGDHWISENVRGQVFFEVGGLGHPKSQSILKWFGDPGSFTTRISAGIGIATRLGKYGRAELNYCLPLRYDSGGVDAAHRGLQFGIGVNYS